MKPAFLAGINQFIQDLLTGKALKGYALYYYITIAKQVGCLIESRILTQKVDIVSLVLKFVTEKKINSH